MTSELNLTAISKSTILLISILLISVISFSQTTVFHENFEAPLHGDSVTSSQTTSSVDDWGINSALFYSGLYSDTCQVVLGDTTYLTTDAFSTLGNTYVILDFDQICKVEWNDAAEIQVSNNNGTTWNTVTATQYHGSGQFPGHFNSFSYGADWNALVDSIQPDNSWWKHEIFDISFFAGNASQVKVRFLLRDGDNDGPVGTNGTNYGWILDNLKVTASISELFPPIITYLTPVLEDTMYTSGSYTIQATINDISGIDTAYIAYSVNSIILDTIPMTIVSGDTFSGTIPFYGFGRTILYNIVAIDGSLSGNVSINPSVGSKMIYAKYLPLGTITIGTGVLDDDNYGPMYRSSATSSFDYSRYSYLFTQAEIIATGMSGGTQITKVEWYKVTAFETLGNASFNIYMKNSTASALTTNTPWTSVISGATQVLNNTTQIIPVTTGWIPFPITSFAYSGQGIEISTDWDISAVAGNPATGKLRWQYASGLSSIKTIGAAANNTANLTTLNTGGYGGTMRPNIRITYVTPNNLSEDAGVVSIISPNGGIAANTDVSGDVLIKNFGIDTLTTIDIEWTLNGLQQTTISWTGVILPDSIKTINLDTLNLPSGSYTLKSWTESPNGVSDMNLENDTSEFSFYACGSAISGSKTIGGTASDFPDFTSAALAINQCGISGPVIFNVASGTYVEQIEIGNVAGSSSTNTITFKSSSGDSSSVILTHKAAMYSSNYTLKLNGANYISFQGITIEATDSILGRTIEILNSANNLTLSNNIIKNNIDASLAIDHARTLIATTDSIGNNVIIQNNLLIDGSTAIYLDGRSNYSSGWNISSNVITAYNYTAIELVNATDVIISLNEITASSTANNADHKGIYLLHQMGSPVVSRNKVFAMGSSDASGIRLSDCALDSINSGLIVNNFVQTYGSSGQNSGIFIHNTKNCNIVFNSVNVIGNSSTSGSLILLDDGTIPTENITILNNIFTNNAGGNAILTSGIGTSDFTNDYNDLYTYGAANFADLNGTAVTDLSSWKLKSGEGLQSVSINPYFSSTTDLHTTNNLLNAIGTPISGITIDIDGDLRNMSTPDLGADEFTPSPYDIACLEILSPISSCGLDSNEVVTIRIKNAGSSVVNGGITASYRVDSNTTISEVVSNTLYSGDTLDYSFSTNASFDVSSILVDSTFELKAWINLPSDSFNQNDTVKTTINSKYKPAAPITMDTTIAYGNAVTLTAQHIDTNLFWYPYDTSATEIYEGQFFTTPQLFDTTTYWVSVGGGSAFLDTINPSTYSSTYTSTTGVRGYHFQAPTDFVITGLRVPTTVGTDPQCIEVLKYSGPYVSSSDPHTVLFYVSGVAGSDYITCNIPIASGDYISIHGSRGTTTHNNSYAPSSAISIYGQYATIGRSWYNGALYTNSAPSGSVTRSVGGSIGQVDFIYGNEVSGCESDRSPLTVKIVGFPSEDAGISQILNPTGTVCSSNSQEVKFKLKNSGFDTLQSVNIHWTLDGVPQDSIIWNGSLLNDSSEFLTVDTLVFSGGVYCINAWTNLPNGIQDTINVNDTSHVCVNAGLFGNYTIGDTTGGNVFDYPSFIAAKDALAAFGVCGNVTFLVDSGVYNERLILPIIAGAGPNARITFTSLSGDSTDVTLHYTFGLGGTSMMQLNGNYYTFKNLTLSLLGGTNNGHVVELAGSAKYNEFINCVLEGAISTSTSTNYAVIYANSGDVEYNTLKNNLILNGTYPIYLYASSSNMAKGNAIEGNTIMNYYNNGPYFYRQDSLSFNSNYVENGPSTSVYGVKFYYSAYLTVTKNQIVVHGTGSHYGFDVYYCTASPSRPHLFANNFVTLSGSGSGTWHGMSLYRNSGINIYNNSILLSGGSSSSGRCIYQTLGDNHRIINNIMTNTGGGYAYYVSLPNAIIASDNNSLYSSGTNLAYWSGDHISLNTLKATSGKDIHSNSALPLFNSVIDLHLGNSNLSGLGMALAEITDDIDGDLRSPYPTIGADELPAIAIDLGVSNIINPTLNAALIEASTNVVKIILTNYGTDTINGANIQYSINNAAPVTMTYSNTLLPFASDTVVMTSFIAPAGNSNICVKSILASDTNTFNDEFCLTFYGIPVYDAFVKEIIEINDGCGLGLDTIKVWIHNLGIDTINGVIPNTISANYQIVGGTQIISQNITSMINPGDSILFEFNTLVNLGVSTSSSLFEILAWVDLTGDNISNNDTLLTDVYSYHTPADPLAPNVIIPYASPATLLASSPTNDSLVWYDLPIGGNTIAQGNILTMPVLYTTDTVYVEAIAGNHDLKITEVIQNHYSGNGATIPTPAYLGSANHFIEITNLGISSVDLTGYTYHREGYGALNYSLPSIVLYSGEVLVLSTYGESVGSPANNFYIAGNSSISPANPTGSWITDPNNLVVDAVAINGHYFTAGSGVTLADWSSNSLNISLSAGIIRMVSDNNSVSDWITADHIDPSTLGVINPALSVGNSNGGCVSNRVPVVINVGNQVSCDVGVFVITEPISGAYLSTSEIISVQVNNYGSSSQSTIPVSYQIDNGTIITDTILAAILPNDSLVYTFGTIADLSIIGNIYQLKTWTSLACDTNQLNDTNLSNVQNSAATYCISKATSTEYVDIENVTFSGINNTSLPPFNKLYTDYTNTSPAIISKGNIYPISIKISSNNAYPSSGFVEVYIDYNKDGSYDEVTETAYGSSFLGITSSAPLVVQGNVHVPPGMIDGSTEMRVVVKRDATSSFVVNPCGTYTSGETEDYSVFIAPNVPTDAGVTAIIQPNLIATNSTVIKAIIANFGSDSITSVDVSYEINSGTPITQTWTGLLHNGDTATIIFPATTLPDGQNDICVYTSLPNDTITINDQKCVTSYKEFIAQLPYVDDFEGVNYWLPDTMLNQWEFGTPSSTSINTAHSPSTAWMIDLNSNYANYSFEYLYSPKFDNSTVSLDSIKFWHYYNTQIDEDGGFIQYLTTSGYWITLGLSTNDTNGVNWYNNYSGGLLQWSGDSQGWIRSAYDLSTVTNMASPAQFRFLFTSDVSINNYDGWAIDDFEISIPLMANDPSIESIVLPNDSTETGYQQTVEIKIKNSGTNTLTSIPVGYKIDSKPSQLETWTGNLLPDSTINYSFITNYLTPSSDYNLCAWVSAANPTYTFNDSTCVQIIAKQAAYDAGICALEAPYDTLYCDVKVWIKNYGKNILDTVDVFYHLNGVIKVTGTWIGTLNPNDSVLYTFPTVFPPLGMLNLCVGTDLTGDLNSTNDSICKTVIGSICDIGFADNNYQGFKLKQNNPNPADVKTNIEYIVPKAGLVHFELVNSYGQVLIIREKKVNVGTHTMELDVRDLQMGVYFYSMTFEGRKLVKKMLIVK